jgi:hypothetical protein
MCNSPEMAAAHVEDHLPDEHLEPRLVDGAIVDCGHAVSPSFALATRADP